MKHVSKITEVGNSLYILLDKNLVNSLGAKKDDLAEIDVNIIAKNSDFKVKEYKCLVCSHQYFLNEELEDIYCSYCGNDNLDAIKEIEGEN